MRRTIATFLFTLALSNIPQVALAAKYTDAVSGRELFATPTLGVFAGFASGSLPGAWTAVVSHTPLSGTTPAAITGGSFALTSGAGDDASTVRGTFSGGTVTQTSGFAGCAATQTYDVAGTLANVGEGGGTGSGTFNAVLTHFNVLLFGRCITYKATVAGVVTLSF